MYIYIYKYVYICTYIYILYTYTHTHIHAHSRTHTRIHAHARTHTRIHAHTHTHTHTHEDGNEAHTVYAGHFFEVAEVCHLHTRPLMERYFPILHETYAFQTSFTSQTRSKRLFPLTRETQDDDDCFYAYSWRNRNNVMIMFGASFFLVFSYLRLFCFYTRPVPLSLCHFLIGPK